MSIGPLSSLKVWLVTTHYTRIHNKGTHLYKSLGFKKYRTFYSGAFLNVLSSMFLKYFFHIYFSFISYVKFVKEELYEMWATGL